MKNWKIGIVGAGEVVQKHHLPAISSLELEVPEICDSEEAYALMLNNKAIDVIAVCTPNYLHVNQAIAALDAGKKVILEKPIATTLADAKRLLAHPRVADVAVCYQRRFNTQCMAIKQYAQTHPIFDIDAVILVHRDPPYWKTWRSEQEKSGGGNLMNIDIHYLDLMLWWTGESPQVKSVDIDYASFGRDAIDIELLAHGSMGASRWWLRGSARNDKRHIQMTVTFQDGRELLYNTDDASHYEIYDRFLNHNEKISVEEAYQSLELVLAIYAQNNSGDTNNQTRWLGDRAKSTKTAIV